MLKAEYVIVGVLAGFVAYNAYAMYCIRRDHPNEYNAIYSQLAGKYRNGALILALIVAVVVMFGMNHFMGKKEDEM